MHSQTYWTQRDLEYADCIPCKKVKTPAYLPPNPPGVLGMTLNRICWWDSSSRDVGGVE